MRKTKKPKRRLIPYAGHPDFNPGVADEPIPPPWRWKVPRGSHKGRRNEEMKHLDRQFEGH